MEPVTFQYQSQILAGGQHSFAVYNDQHRLISDPLSELYAETKSKPISDVYVISHGWNFTLDEAYANYHNYMELLDRHLTKIQDQEKDPTFHPYFIYVVWPSVVRPLGDIAHALLPFTLDKAIAPLTNLVDSVVFHVPSGWKESLNASSLALGTRYPIVYEEALRDLGEKPSGIKGEDQNQVSDDRWLAPPHAYCGPVEQRKTAGRADTGETPRIVYDAYHIDTGELMGRECPLSTLVYHILRWRSANSPSAKIHLVGHSYGAKVVTLAGMEAIRLQRAIGQTGEGRRGAIEGDPLPSEQSIASLVLFNPAFHPRELHYPVRLPSFSSTSFRVDPGLSDEVELLQNIPRKAVLYSSRDYATGRLFDISQVVFSNEYAQYAQPLANIYNIIPERVHYGSTLSRAFFEFKKTVNNLGNGSGTLAASVLGGVWSWSGTKIINILPDWISHARQNDFYGFKWSTGDSCTTVFTRGVLNTFDYWMPLGRVVTNADADKMGILRTAIPALGSIGMDRLVARRWFTPNGGHIQELIGDDTDRRPIGGVHHDFCKVAGSPAPLKEFFDPHHFYSYDATSVMDTGTWGAGSHGDVRSTDPPSKGHCRSIYTSDDTPKSERLLEKREYMFNFTYNFTRTPAMASQSGTSNP